MKAPDDLRGSSFGALAAIQSFGNLIASSLVGVLYVAISSTAAFLVLAIAMVVALAVLLSNAGQRRGTAQTTVRS